jgi:hypothetical protein
MRSDDVKYPRYLGDAVYASVTHGMVKLHTSDGIRETNSIWFEVETLDAFLVWLADMRAAMIAELEVAP